MISTISSMFDNVTAVYDLNITNHICAPFNTSLIVAIYEIVVTWWSSGNSDVESNTGAVLLSWDV